MSPPAGGLAITVQVWANDDVQDTWTFTTETAGQTECDMAWAPSGRNSGPPWVPSSDNCTLTETAGGLDEGPGLVAFYARASFLGSSSDQPSTSQQVLAFTAE